MKKKNILMMAMSLVLVAVIAVGGTLAYLTSNTKTLTNTFTVGNGYNPDNPDGFYLDETAMPDDGTNPGKINPNDRERVGNDYVAMTVGDAIAKDPTFHLTEGPESYVFAKVTGVDEMIAAGFIVSNEAPTDGKNTDTMANGLNTTNWVQIEKENDEAIYDGYYVYKVAEDDYTVTPSQDALERLFASVSIDKDASTLPTLTKNINDTIVIKGIAVQADNLDSYDLAWKALKGQEQATNDFFK